MARRLISVFCAYWLTFASVYACSIDYTIWMQRTPNADPLYRFIKRRKMGFIDQRGRVVVPPQLEYLGGNYGDEFHDGLLEIGIGHGKYIDRNGNRTIDKEFATGWDFSEGFAAAIPKSSRKWGYIDTKGDWAISPRFDVSPNGSVDSFRDGFAKIDVSGKIGYIDHSGAFTIVPRFLDGESFYDGMARVVVEGPCLYGNLDGLCGSPSVLPKGSKPDSFLPPCKYAFVDRSGKIISDDRYDYADHFAEGLAPVQSGRQWGYVDKTGKMVIAPQFDTAAPFSDGVALVSTNRLFGYIDHAGKFVIPPRFAYAEDFSEGFAVVGSRNSGVWYSDHTGKQAIPGKFAAASGFFKGLAHVKLTSRSDDQDAFVYIDRTGRHVFTYTITDRERP